MHGYPSVSASDFKVMLKDETQPTPQDPSENVALGQKGYASSTETLILQRIKRLTVIRQAGPPAGQAMSAIRRTGCMLTWDNSVMSRQSVCSGKREKRQITKSRSRMMHRSGQR